MCDDSEVWFKLVNPQPPDGYKALWCMLQGRATVEMNIKLKETRNDGVSGGQLKIVADGYNAPVTAGNFIDLVQRGFYNNMEIQRSDGFVVQTGDPGPEQVCCSTTTNWSLLRAIGQCW